MGNVTKDSLIVLGILAAMVISATLFVYVPQASSREQLETEIATLKTSLAADAEKARVVPQMLRHIDEMKKRYNKRWEKKLPKRKELGAFLREISENLEREELAGKLIEPGNPKKEELFHTLPILMRFQGSFTALSNFLDRLDRMERLTRIQNVHISADNNHVPAVLDVQLRMNIYFTDTEDLPG
ncbi:MAG: type IV pilus inner membrane component PilO [Planctomycetota bacterium]|jgi:Tfp pilus assembly protein PilO